VLSYFFSLGILLRGNKYYVFLHWSPYFF
jgi:hypothetical protein